MSGQAEVASPSEDALAFLGILESLPSTRESVFEDFLGGLSFLSDFEGGVSGRDARLATNLGR